MSRKVLDSFNRFRLADDEMALLEKYRASKTELEKECEASGIDVKDVRHYWYKSKLFSIFAKPSTKSIEDLKSEIIKGMDNHSPKYPKIQRKKVTDPHCLVIDPADIHIGKLSSEYETNDKYNSSIAVKRVKDGVRGVLDYTRPFGIDQIVLILGNDILHTDNTKRMTTSGTPQDTDGMWYDNFMTAQKLYVDIIDILIDVCDVHIIHNVSNHDYMTGWFLSQVIKTWYKDCKNVTFDVNMNHRKAFKYHKNLIGSTHGDGAKEKDLPILMAQEYPKLWSATTHRYIYDHHIHHKRSKDYIGATIESSRSASGTDSWHHRNGYQHAPKAIEAYLHHPLNGQVARFTHIF